MATAQTIIDAAYRKIGYSDSTTADNTNALGNLNNMIESWGYLNHYIVRESLSLTIDKAEYTIGSGGSLNTVRPVAILDAFLRDSDDHDWPLGIISDRKYNSISAKSAKGMPSCLYFLPEYPLAKIIFNCEPDKVYTLHLSSQKNFTEFEALETSVNLPPEFIETLVYNLAITLAEDKGISVKDTVLATAQQLKNNIEKINAINRPVPESTFEFNAKSLNILTGK